MNRANTRTQSSPNSLFLELATYLHLHIYKLVLYYIALNCTHENFQNEYIVLVL